MAPWPVVLRMYVDDRWYVEKIRRAVYKVPGVESVWASPERHLVVVNGRADAWALKRRILRKLNRDAIVLGDGSAPYPTDAPYYGPSQAYGHGAAQPQHVYYSDPYQAYYSDPQPPSHDYYSHPPPHRGYRYAARSYDGWSADRDPYYYAVPSTVPTCSILCDPASRPAMQRRRRACMLSV